MSKNDNVKSEVAKLNVEMSDLIRATLQKKSLNGLCYNCGSAKKALLPNACILSLANSNQDYEITFGVVCAHCGLISHFLPHLLLNEDEQKRLDEISEKIKSLLTNDGDEINV